MVANVMILENSTAIEKTMQEQFSWTEYRLLKPFRGRPNAKKIIKKNPDLILMDVPSPNHGFTSSGLCEFIACLRYAGYRGKFASITGEFAIAGHCPDGCETCYCKIEGCNYPSKIKRILDKEND